MKETNVSMMYNSNEVKNVFSVLYKTPMSNTFDRKVFTDKLSRDVSIDNLIHEGYEVFSIGYTPMMYGDIL